MAATIATTTLTTTTAAASPAAEAAVPTNGGRARRSPSLENYRRVERSSRNDTPLDEVRITSAGPVQRYVAYAEKVLESEESVTLRATGMAIAVAVAVAEVVKRRVRQLHQSNSIVWTDLIDEYQPLVEGLEPRTTTRSVPSLSILLTRDQAKAESNPVGYQPPLEHANEDAAKAEADAIILSSGRGRKGGKRVRRPQNNASPTEQGQQGQDQQQDQQQGQQDQQNQQSGQQDQQNQQQSGQQDQQNQQTEEQSAAGQQTNGAAASGDARAATRRRSPHALRRRKPQRVRKPSKKEGEPSSTGAPEQAAAAPAATPAPPLEVAAN